MAHVYTLHNHQIVSCNPPIRQRNAWLLWDITIGTLGLICFGGLLTALYIIA